MPRRSRKNGTKQLELSIWKTALYVRLSIEDNGKKGGDSAENQLDFLKNFAEQHEWMKIVESYIDNGQTGTDFERPEWERLLSDIRKRRVNCIIVKDLSRFARNYLEAGDYLQKIFPFMGIRLIAINDQYDSKHEIFPEKDLLAEFKNLANDQYSRDISRKVMSSFRIKKEAGEFIGSKAPYGYLIKDRHLVVDEPAAAVVKRIFEMRIKGISAYKIARILNEEGILSPSAYARERGCKKYKSSDVIWQTEAITKILYDQVYIGDLVQGKYNWSIYSTQKQGKRKEEEWNIVENAHQGIIERSSFAKIQHIKEKNREIRMSRAGNPSYKNVLEGICICGICKRRMRRLKDLRKGKALYYFYCTSSTLTSQTECNTKSIADYRIFNLVLKQIRLQIDLAVENREVIRRLKEENFFAKKLKKLESEMKKKLLDKERYSYLKAEAYRDFKQGILSGEEYHIVKEKYTQNIMGLDQKLEEMQMEKEEIEAISNAENKWMQAFLKFRNENNLTREMAESLLEKVEIYGDMRVHIVFKFQNEYECLRSWTNGGEMKGDVRKEIPG